MSKLLTVTPYMLSVFVKDHLRFWGRFIAQSEELVVSYADQVNSLICEMIVKGPTVDSGAYNVVDATDRRSSAWRKASSQEPGVPILAKDYELAVDIASRVRTNEWLQFPLQACERTSLCRSYDITRDVSFEPLASLVVGNLAIIIKVVDSLDSYKLLHTTGWDCVGAAPTLYDYESVLVVVEKKAPYVPHMFRFRVEVWHGWVKDRLCELRAKLSNPEEWEKDYRRLEPVDFAEYPR